VTAGQRLPLRERKKAATRARILEVAGRLFEEHGYDAVTVAEIADAADVSVKTVFVYFRSKEDLAVADTSLLDALVAALADRAPATTPAQVVGDVLDAALDAPDRASTGLEAYFRRAGDAPALRSRLLRLWAEYEDAVATVLARDAGRNSTVPADRLAAITLVGIVRSFTAPEVRRLAADAPGAETEALRTWLRESVRRVDATALVPGGRAADSAESRDGLDHPRNG
jgi:AcrR family transcriptional regulator